jgi:hypothetical protein
LLFFPVEVRDDGIYVAVEPDRPHVATVSDVMHGSVGLGLLLTTRQRIGAKRATGPEKPCKIWGCQVAGAGATSFSRPRDARRA